MTDWKEKYPIGSLWRTRDGGKVMIMEHADIDNDYQILGYQYGRGDVSYTTEGKYYIKEKESQEDLISPWTELRKGALWVSVYQDGSYNIWKIKPLTTLAMIAKIPVEWTEGEGLDNE